jgi:endonuclease/exonuclease/phosphatase family metal-dependent hydrolase
LVGKDKIGGELGDFQDASLIANGESIATMPSHDPAVTLDYIFVRNVEVKRCWAVGSAADAMGYYPSDHLGLAASLEPRTAFEEAIAS